MVIAVLWIRFSDWLLERLTTDPQLNFLLQTLKGFFVAVTAVLLLFTLRMQFFRIKKAQEAEEKSKRRLEDYLAASPGVVYVVEIAEGEMKTVYISKNAKEIFGCELDLFLA